MEIQATIIGLGKLGSSMLAVFASKGIVVRGYDLDQTKVDSINSGEAPVYEPGVDELIKKHKSNIECHSTLENAISDSDISFIVAPTPSTNDGRFDCAAVVKCAESIGQSIKDMDQYHVVVLTSTVLPGDSRKYIIPALENASGKTCGVDFGFCYSPEFIALGTVVADLTNPDYFLIGEIDEKSGTYLASINKIVAGSDVRISHLTIEEAEIAKIATNSFVTMKVAFANMILQAADAFEDASHSKITIAIGQDQRIGEKYFKGGLSFGGPCFPRDNVAFAKFFEEQNQTNQIPLAVHKANSDHSKFISQRIINSMNDSKTVGFLGASYKPGSNLVTASATLEMAEWLLDGEYDIYIFDYLATILEPSEMTKRFQMTGDLSHCLSACDTFVICHADQRLVNDFLAGIGNKKGKETTVIDCWGILSQMDIPDDIRLINL